MAVKSKQYDTWLDEIKTKRRNVKEQDIEKDTIYNIRKKKF